ncbi:putative formin-like protein 5 [Iris pallida]|uniref:Formin-like protein 5 n=1 Tax=Iris pallida TaxID=29817 RepID=A0AAX6EHI8_IRIPA|nr:putative formin-like protein 5 [Iris pallida]
MCWSASASFFCSRPDPSAPGPSSAVAVLPTLDVIHLTVLPRPPGTGYCAHWAHGLDVARAAPHASRAWLSQVPTYMVEEYIRRAERRRDPSQ